MNVVEKNTGTKIPYKVSGTKITFDGVLMLDLSAWEQDDAVHIDISQDARGMLTMGTARRYVAQLDIPAREYTVKSTGDTDDEGNILRTRAPVGFDVNNVTLTLWSVEG